MDPEAGEAPPRSRSPLAGLLLIAGGLLAMGLVFEVVLRLLPSEIRGYDIDERTFVRVQEFQPDEARNSAGYHDVEHDPKARGPTRVFLIGDSYVEALQVPIFQTPGQQLQRYLVAKSGEEHEVISLARPGWGQISQYVFLRDLGPVYEPEIVITLFLALNDVRDDSNELTERFKRNDRKLLQLGWRPGWKELPFDRVPGLVFEASELNRFLSLRLEERRRTVKEPRGPDDTGVPFDYFVYSAEYDDAWKRAWRKKEKLLAATKRLANGMGADYLVVSASTSHGVLGQREGLRQLKRAYPAMDAFDWELEMPDRMLSEICQRQGIPLLLLEPLFRDLTRDGAQLHLRFDGHWNREGNRLAGEVIADFVLSNTGAAE